MVENITITGYDFNMVSYILNAVPDIVNFIHFDLEALFYKTYFVVDDLKFVLQFFKHFYFVNFVFK